MRKNNNNNNMRSPEMNVLIGTLFLIACSALLQYGCGNGVLNWWEECDDGNLYPGDACNEFCKIEYCGDGITNNRNEECDDGNKEDGDGCSSACTIEGNACPSLQMIVRTGTDKSAATVQISTYNESIVVSVASRLWKTKEVCLHVGHDPVTLTAEGNADPTAFPFSTDFKGKAVSKFRGTFTFVELGVKCGEDVYVSLHMEMVQMDKSTHIVREERAWALGSHMFPGDDGGSYSMYHICC